MGKEMEKVNPERQRQRFTREFKLEAARLELERRPATQLALKLGIRLTCSTRGQIGLRGKGNQAFRGQGRRPVDRQSEMVRLKAELKKVMEERDILKRAAAYFSKELK